MLAFCQEASLGYFLCHQVLVYLAAILIKGKYMNFIKEYIKLRL